MRSARFPRLLRTLTHTAIPHCWPDAPRSHGRKRGVFWMVTSSVAQCNQRRGRGRTCQQDLAATYVASVWSRSGKSHDGRTESSTSNDLPSLIRAQESGQDPVKRTESRLLSLRATTAERRTDKTAAAATHASPTAHPAAMQRGGINACQVVLGAFRAAPGQPSSPSPTPQPAPRGPGAPRAHSGRFTDGWSRGGRPTTACRKLTEAGVDRSP